MARLSMKLEGIEDLNKMLTDLAPNEAKNLLRSTVHGIAGLTRDRLRAVAPFPHMRKSTKAVRRRARAEAPVSDVRMAADWRWFEFGTAERVQKSTGRRAGRIKAQPFVVPQVELLRGDMAAIYRQQFGTKLERALARKARNK